MQPEVLSLGEVPGLGEVRLRPWRDDDHAAVLRAYHDPDIIRRTTQVPVMGLPCAGRPLTARRHETRPQASPAQTTQAGTSLSPSGTAHVGETRVASSG
jgi:hypothetical protein